MSNPLPSPFLDLPPPSPEQKAHDAKKDRAALDRGYLTMRFTGSEIFRDADACALKIYDAVSG